MTEFKIGDRVRTPMGEVNVITRVREEGEDRDGNYDHSLVYYVESGFPGSSIVWWRAEQLTPALLLTPEQEAELATIYRAHDLSMELWRKRRIAIDEALNLALRAFKERCDAQVKNHD